MNLRASFKPKHRYREQKKVVISSKEFSKNFNKDENKNERSNHFIRKKCWNFSKSKKNKKIQNYSFLRNDGIKTDRNSIRGRRDNHSLFVPKFEKKYFRRKNQNEKSGESKNSRLRSNDADYSGGEFKTVYDTFDTPAKPYQNKRKSLLTPEIYKLKNRERRQKKDKIIFKKQFRVGKIDNDKNISLYRNNDPVRDLPLFHKKKQNLGRKLKKNVRIGSMGNEILRRRSRSPDSFLSINRSRDNNAKGCMNRRSPETDRRTSFRSFISSKSPRTPRSPIIDPPPSKTTKLIKKLNLNKFLTKELYNLVESLKIDKKLDLQENN